MSSSRLTLYIWPHRWSLPSFDPDCLSCVFYLQLNFAGKYDLVECTDPDVSPSGSLPFLIHEEKQVATSRSVLSYLSKLKGGENGLRGNGTNEERLVKAQRTAWSAYVDSHLRDLVNHVLYANPTNYRAGIHTALVDLLPIPARYYLPARLRERVREMLEPAGLWHLEEEEEKPKKGPFDKPLTIADEKNQIIRDTFGKEKLLDRARSIFDLLNPLLGHRSFFLGSQPTAVDVQIASYILVLTHAPIPENPLVSLLNKSYPHLMDHSGRILSMAFPPSNDGSIPRPQVTRAPHANPAVQLSRAVRRVVDSIALLQA